MNNPAFCILAAGKGARLGTLTAKINKALLPIGNRAAISYIIEKVPPHYDIVVALGYLGQAVKEYCLAAFPNRRFTFVEVKNWEGLGSGPGQSLLECKEHLQRPFVWSTVDCIVNEFIWDPRDGNWLGVAPTTEPTKFSTCEIDLDTCITKFKNKSESGYNLAFIGLAGIKEHELFWKLLEGHSEPEKEVVAAFYNPKLYTKLKARLYTWHDTGSPEGYLKAQQNLSTSSKLSISKTTNEITYLDQDKIIKFIGDPDRLRERIIRSDNLKGYNPSLTFKGQTMYAYAKVPGKTLYEVNNPLLYMAAYHYCKDNFWSQKKVIVSGFKEACYNFYHTKTYDRLHALLAKKPESYRGTHIINNRICAPIEELLDLIDWEELTDGWPTTAFHGDLQFDNIIYNPNAKHRLYFIDWRESFGGRTDVGDKYYDMAKLLGGMYINYYDMKKLLPFLVEVKDKEVELGYSVSWELSNASKKYEEALKETGEFDRVVLLTALIFLNMSPLHTDKFDDYLFFRAKYMLQGILNDK